MPSKSVEKKGAKSVKKSSAKSVEKKSVKKTIRPSMYSMYRRERNILIQDINRGDLVTLEKLCEDLNIHYDSTAIAAAGGFNYTYFTHINDYPESKIAIRVSQKPVAKYLDFPRDKSQSFLTYPSKRVYEGKKQQIRMERVDDSSLPTKVVEEGEFLIQLETSKTNWINSSLKGLCPPIIYYGYIIKAVQIGGMSSGSNVEIRSCIISERYSMDLKGFYKDIVMTDIYDERDKRAINERVLKQVQTLIHGLVELSIICADIKPANMVVKYNTRSDGKIDINSIVVRLIDLDGDWCTRMENGMIYRPGGTQRTLQKDRKQNIELLMLVILGFHFNIYIKYNPFTDYFKEVLIREKKLELVEMMRKPHTMRREDITKDTDLDLLPLNATYKHYFLDRSWSFLLLSNRLTRDEVESSSRSSHSQSSPSESRSPLSNLSTGGKKRRNTRYKGNKKNYRSSKRKTMKNHKI